MRKVSLPRAAMYSLLAFLKRNKAKTSPRAIRFELDEGKAPRIVLEPWEKTIQADGSIYNGPPTNPIRVWGRRRLLTLSRLLPLAEGFDVYLLGTGLPSFWVARLGPMRLTLGLSGWTTNDWSAQSAIEMLMSQTQPDVSEVASIAESLSIRRQGGLSDLAGSVKVSQPVAASALNELALRGQAIYDLHGGVYRWRSILPMALSDKEMGPPHPELQEAKIFLKRKKVQLGEVVSGPRDGLILTGQVDSTPCEVLIDTDGVVRRGKCLCSWHRTSGIRNGPCRHILALRFLYERSKQGEIPPLTSL